MTQPAPHPSVNGGPQGRTGGRRLSKVAHASARGTVAAMAMTGMRVVTVHLGLLEQPPPEAILKKKARGLLRRVPRNRRAPVIEITHWSYGATAGAAFGMLPDRIRLTPWSGPAYGLATWLWFETVIAPVLGIDEPRRPRFRARIALIADHVLYGLVLSELRRRPQS